MHHIDNSSTVYASSNAENKIGNEYKEFNMRQISVFILHWD